AFHGEPRRHFPTDRAAERAARVGVPPRDARDQRQGGAELPRAGNVGLAVRRRGGRKRRRNHDSDADSGAHDVLPSRPSVATGQVAARITAFVVDPNTIWSNALRPSTPITMTSM